MPTIDAHDPGTICWIDLASTDAAGATTFYCDLFGWTATEPAENAGGYRMLMHDGRQVAGLAPVWAMPTSPCGRPTCRARMPTRRARRPSRAAGRS